jgi:cell wall-associated NlpC family hydrolase
VRSHSFKRVVSGILAASAVIAVMSVAQSPATAAPARQTPPASSDALAKYRELSAEAEKLNEQFLSAKDGLTAKQAELDKATHDLNTAKEAGAKASVDESHFRVDVDKFANATFTSGVQLNKLSALLSGSSGQDFLERATALDVLATDRNRALSNFTGAVDQAAQAAKTAADSQTRSQQARDAAAKLKDDVAAQKSALDKQIKDLGVAAGRLSAADKALQADKGGSAPNLKAPGPAAQMAIDAALSKLGKPYVYGATGPGSFDCSGLTSWAYNQGGVTIPRTSGTQSGFGAAVSRSALQPGDLVFYGSPAYHVGIYLGDGKMVHAPTSGDVVKISSLQNDYSGARRPS